MKNALLLFLVALPVLAQNPREQVRLMEKYALAGDKEKAFAILDQLAKHGFGAVNMLNADDDLVSLRGDPRWKTALAEMQRIAHPCLNAPEFRQFDYWLGEWDVEIGGQKAAKSSIQLILDDCVIFENYSSAIGYAGKSFSIYDAAHKKWEQRYVDTGGAFHQWSGGLENGVMTFRWDHDGSFNRMTYTKEGPDRVRQVLETSTDGKSWTKTYDGLYIRRR
ncbi:MAG TPA: hypothetical protein VKU62_04530 [Thermoanaerobaculia bacterium]|nr:hypothetical protein [Thermoanaerobaculia bacterium]